MKTPNYFYYKATLLVQMLEQDEDGSIEDLGFNEVGRWTGETVEAVVAKVQAELNLRNFAPAPEEPDTLVCEADASENDEGYAIFEVHTLSLMRVELEHLDASVLKKGLK